MRELRAAPQHPAGFKGLHRTALRESPREPHFLSAGALSEAGEGK